MYQTHIMIFPSCIGRKTNPPVSQKYNYISLSSSEVNLASLRSLYVAKALWGVDSDHPGNVSET